MSDLAIAMIASPRTDINVRDTIASLRHGGFKEEVHVFTEPGTVVEEAPSVVVRPNSRRLGARDNWLGALRWLFESTTAPHLLLVEDDVACCRGTRRAVELCFHSTRECGYLNLVTPVQSQPYLGETESGWVTLEVADIWGTQAICFVRDTVGGFLQYASRRTSDPRSICYDLLLQEYYRHVCRKPCYYHVPSLCEHVGWSETTIEKPEAWVCDLKQRHLRRGYRFDAEYVPDHPPASSRSDGLGGSRDATAHMDATPPAR